MDLTLEFQSEEEAQRIFEALSRGGTVKMPFERMFWGRCSAAWKIRLAWFGRFQLRLSAVGGAC